jgi:protein-tyrosine phosphatase
VLVTLPDGAAVLAHGRLGLVAADRVRRPDFAVYLDDRWADDPEVTWPYRMIDWPDFGVPSDESELFRVIREVHERAKSGELIELACYGGIGRTGTVLSCLVVCAGVPPERAVEWVREHYDVRAVETDAQGELIDRFAQSGDETDSTV